MPSPSSEPGGPHSLSPDEAFALLANDTRVGILRALWADFESGKRGNALPYSELFGRVEIADSGNFSYHLESDRTGRHHGPDREAERRAIDGLPS